MPSISHETYFQLRTGARGLLNQLSTPSNPGVSDQWIVGHLRQHANLTQVEYAGENDDTFTDNFYAALLSIIEEQGRNPEYAASKTGEEVNPTYLLNFLYHTLLVPTA